MTRRRGRLMLTGHLEEVPAMGNDGYDLFEDYPVNGNQIRAVADDTSYRVSAVRGLTDQLLEQHQAAVEAVEGNLLDSMRDAPTDVLTRATETNRQGMFAAGCLGYFAVAVDGYNFAATSKPRSVRELNRVWQEAVVGGFGLDYDIAVSDSSPQEYERTRTAYFTELAERRNQLRSVLTVENSQAIGLLDQAADDVATMLAGGPDDHASVRALWAAGVLPFYAPLIFTDTDLTRTPTTARVAQDLEGYLDATPCQRDNPYLQVLQSTVVGPPPSPEQIEQSLADLRGAGLLGEDEEPDELYLAWLTWSLRKGLTPDGIVERARQEEVTMDSFDPLRELEEVVDPEGRRFYLLESDRGAKDVARATELVNGGTPSITDLRRSNNEWTYDGHLAKPLGPPSDVETVLDAGGAITTTPEGTLMVAPGPDTLGIIPNIADLASFRGGTTIMEMYIINASFSDPAAALRERIETGTDDGTDQGQYPGDLNSYDEDGETEYDGSDSLAHRLLHERMHSAQWGRWGWRFVQHYLTNSQHHEEDAVLAWGGYGDDAMAEYRDDAGEMIYDWPVCEPAEPEGDGPPSARTTTTTTTTTTATATATATATPDDAPEETVPSTTPSAQGGPPVAHPPNTTTTTTAATLPHDG